MAKFGGMVGFVYNVETRPGVFAPKKTERLYYGDVIRSGFAWQGANQVNPNLTLSNRISLVADPFANDHLGDMKYVILRGSKWQIKDVDASTYPRVIVTLGGVYNG